MLIGPMEDKRHSFTLLSAFMKILNMRRLPVILKKQSNLVVTKYCRLGLVLTELKKVNYQEIKTPR